MKNVPPHERVEVGNTGRTLGPLRPSGRILIDDEIIDVVTEGDFIAGDTQVRVIAKQGHRIVVRQV
jgi:membrane-bound serine protease (ClpP class)